MVAITPTPLLSAFLKIFGTALPRCNTGGDVIKLVRGLYGKNYRQTAAFLSSLADTAPTSLQRLLCPLSQKILQTLHRPFAAQCFNPMAAQKTDQPELRPVALKPALITEKAFSAVVSLCACMICSAIPLAMPHDN